MRASAASWVCGCRNTGKSLNPAIDIGQVEGAFIKGMGWLTCEELVWLPKTGALLTHAPSTYKIPTANDLPGVFNTRLYDNGNVEDSIHRSKAVGEPPLLLPFSVFFAIRDAVAAAGGDKDDPVLSAPATPEAILVGWTRHFTGGGDSGGLALAFNALSSLFLWTAVAVILRDLFRTPEAGAGNVLGAICGYLIAADAWSGINISAYLLAPHSFAFDPGVQELLGHWHGRLALFCYYSFSQMTMLGYSDITPVRAPATSLSLFAALFGMFYTAIVVSQFVGLAQAAPRDGA